MLDWGYKKNSSSNTFKSIKHVAQSWVSILVPISCGPNVFVTELVSPTKATLKVSGFPCLTLYLTTKYLYAVISKPL